MIEVGGREAVVSPVPPDRQTMRLDRVFWSHFSPNLGPGGWVVGALLAHLGLDPVTGLVAITVGNLLGALPVALCAAIGPVSGLPQMEGARVAFGRGGLRLPAALNWVLCVGWDAVNNVPAATALLALAAVAGLSLPFAGALALLVAVQLAAAVHGHDRVQDLQKFLGVALLLAFTAIGVRQLAAAAPAAARLDPHPTVAHAVLAIAIIASFNLSWASYSSDYTRYLPATTKPGAVIGRCFAALLLSAVPFQVLGLVTARSFADASPTAVIAGLGQLDGSWALLALAAIALSSITANSVNDNTASYSLVSAGVPVGRIAAAIATALLGYALAVAGHGRYADLYGAYLVLTLYWIAPWTAIVLADWWHDGRRERTVPPGWTADAWLFVAVTILTIGLFSSTAVYTGPVARALGGADIGYDVGFGAAFAGAVLLRRWRRPAFSGGVRA